MKILFSSSGLVAEDCDKPSNIVAAFANRNIHFSVIKDIQDASKDEPHDYKGKIDPPVGSSNGATACIFDSITTY